uniref:Trehalase n=1 Tax=Tanacetum cinerariifolium TaxID=118510 RepID=A0A6L2JHS5_TANCI|nr:probable trehalase [Tanacetum cinerariifolium]
MNLYGEEFLQKPTYTGIEKLYAYHNEKHGFPGMLGSIDCTNWPWANFPVAFKAQFSRGDHRPDPFILLEVIASNDLWIWHAFFGVSGMNNDHQSFRDYLVLNCDCVGVGDLGLSDCVMVLRQKMGQKQAPNQWTSNPMFFEKVLKRILKHPELHTLLPLRYPAIIPGSRGLLASKMYETTKGIVLNPIDLIHKYGYVLNGARACYTNRSQPPLLSSMVVEVYTWTNDMDLVKKALPTLIKEHKFWNSGIHNVAIEDDQGLTHNLSRYYAMWNQPRPESFTIERIIEELGTEINSTSNRLDFVQAGLLSYLYASNLFY